MFGNRRVYHACLTLALSAGIAAAQKLPLDPVPPGKTFLVVLSHHDDHTWQWGFGGFIAKLADAGWTGYYVRTTNDEKDGPPTWGKNDQTNLRESREATSILGIKDVISLNWRNDHMDSIPIKELRAHYILLLRKLRPDVVMTWDPWGHYDRNPDHRKVSRAMGEAVWMAGYANFHPEHLAMGLKPHRPPRVYFTFRSDYGRGHDTNVAVEINEAQAKRKERAMAAHRNVYGPAHPAIPAMTADSRGTGRDVGVEFAEKFWVVAEFDHLPGLKEYLNQNAVAK